MNMSSNTQPKDWAVYCCPFGARIVSPLVPWLLGYVLFVVAAFGCSTFQAELQLDDYYAETDEEKEQFGYWGIQDPDYGGCLEYENEDLDGALKTGRAIGILGAVLGPIVILLLLTTSFLAVPRVATLTLGVVTGVLMPLICGIMFIGLATTLCTDKDFDLKCTPSAKGYLLVPASLFWIGGCIPLCICFKKRRQRDAKTSPELESQGPKSITENDGNYNNIDMPREDIPATRPLASTTRW